MADQHDEEYPNDNDDNWEWFVDQLIGDGAAADATLKLLVISS